MPGLEAAACRCPVVATRSGGPEDYVRDGVSGRLVPVDDPVEMATAIAEVLSLDEAAWATMGQASHELASCFDWDRSAETLEEVLVQAVRLKDVMRLASCC